MVTGKPYYELGAGYFASLQDPEREIRRLIARLQALGHRHPQPSRLTTQPPQAPTDITGRDPLPPAQRGTIHVSDIAGLLPELECHPEHRATGLSRKGGPMSFPGSSHRAGLAVVRPWVDRSADTGRVAWPAGIRSCDAIFRRCAARSGP
jgi:hypothetical protein